MNLQITVEDELESLSKRVNQVLDQWLPSVNQLPFTLHQAMRYATLNGGKRIRPALTYATGKALDLPFELLDSAACAVELMHCYSLIHDDLPAMDNDDLRRGIPTCHRAFDEATAILAGDAMQALAFRVLAEHTQAAIPPSVHVRLIRLLADACGSSGMAGGQAIDLAAVNNLLTAQEIEQMHFFKTGALIRASVLMAATIAENVSLEKFQRLERFGTYIGLAFQITDDILDIEAETDQMGKPKGSDLLRNKPTYPSVVGIEEAKKKATVLLNSALAEIHVLPPQACLLRELGRFMVERKN